VVQTSLGAEVMLGNRWEGSGSSSLLFGGSSNLHFRDFSKNGKSDFSMHFEVWGKVGRR
jgi:hypothetical protein